MLPSETPGLQPSVPAYPLPILSDEQLQQFQAATLESLDEVGVHCPSPPAAVGGETDRTRAHPRGGGAQAGPAIKPR